MNLSHILAAIAIVGAVAIFVHNKIKEWRLFKRKTHALRVLPWLNVVVVAKGERTLATLDEKVQAQILDLVGNGTIEMAFPKGSAPRVEIDITPRRTK